MIMKAILTLISVFILTACSPSKSEEEIKISNGRKNFLKSFQVPGTGLSTRNTLRTWECSGPVILKEGKEVIRCTFLLKGGYVNTMERFCGVKDDGRC